jgi:hypothetical protein
VTSNLPPDGPTDGPEYLEQGGGRALTGDAPGGSRRWVLATVGGVAALALVGAGAWAAVSFFGTGAQPAEALPASTLGYASIDLDPSGGQKIEAIKMLRKFPAVRDEIDLDTDDDVKEKLFSELGLDEECDGLDSADDIEPWLGDRAAVASVDLGEDVPSVVGVLEVTDADAADQGLATLVACGGPEQQGGWVVEGDWAIIGESDAIAQDVVDATAEGSLADDEDYGRWTDEVGDPGVLNLYAAPDAGQYLLDSFAGAFGYGQDFYEEPGSAGATSEEMQQKLEDFGGMALSLRFADAGLELEVAGDATLAGDALSDSEAGDDVLSTLPDDTALAVGVGFVDGWAGSLLDSLAASTGTPVDELVAEIEGDTGLVLPDDAEALLGDSAALAVSSDIDPEAFVNGDGSDLPVGVKIRGDADEIEAVLDKIRAHLPPGEPELVSDTDGDLVAVGLDADYVAGLLGEDQLGDTDAFESVADDAEDAAAVLFVNFDAGGWLDALAEDDQELADNLEPLQAFGLTVSRDDDVAHAVLRLTTND